MNIYLEQMIYIQVLNKINYEQKNHLLKELYTCTSNIYYNISKFIISNRYTIYIYALNTKLLQIHQQTIKISPRTQSKIDDTLIN